MSRVEQFYKIIQHADINEERKAEIKNEVTVAFTRKKSDSKFKTLFQQARDGVLSYTTSPAAHIMFDEISIHITFKILYS